MLTCTDPAENTNGVLYLDAPFAEKDKAKALGAWWNPDEEIRRWYVPEGVDRSPFKRWFLPKGTPIKRGKPSGGHCWSFMDYGHCVNPNCTFKHYYPPGQTAPLRPLPVYTYIRDYDNYRIYEGLSLYRYGGGCDFDEGTEETEETENSDESEDDEDDQDEDEESEHDSESDSCATESTSNSDGDHSEHWRQEDFDWRRFIEIERRRSANEAQARLDFEQESDGHDDTHHKSTHDVSVAPKATRTSSTKTVKVEKAIRKTVTKPVQVQEARVHRGTSTVRSVTEAALAITSSSGDRKDAVSERTRYRESRK